MKYMRKLCCCADPALLLPCSAPAQKSTMEVECARNLVTRCTSMHYKLAQWLPMLLCLSMATAAMFSACRRYIRIPNCCQALRPVESAYEDEDGHEIAEWPCPGCTCWFVCPGLPLPCSAPAAPHGIPKVCSPPALQGKGRPTKATTQQPK